MGESSHGIPCASAKYALGREHQTRLLMELRDVGLSGLAAKSQENLDVEARTERSLQRLERMVKDGLHMQPLLKRGHLGDNNNNNGVVRSSQRLSTHDDTLLPEDECFPSNEIPHISLQGDTISLSMTLFHYCPPSCKCQCHIKYRVHTPTWLRPVLGQMLLQYNFSLLTRRPACDRTSCVSRDSNSIYFQFFLPRWLLPRAILASLTWDCGLVGPSASLCLSVPRVFEFDCGINVALIAGNITIIQPKIATGVLRPTDIDSLSGETVLTVSRDVKSILC